MKTAPTRIQNRLFTKLAWVAALALAWIATWWHLSGEWLVNPQYQFGFGIPLLFLYIVLKRWPGPFSPPDESRARRIVPWFAVLAGLFLFLGEILRWQDPLWRMAGGLFVLGATLLTALFFWRIGGWPLLHRELFPLAFAWLALPWPTSLETELNQQLLRLITNATVVLTNLAGIAALQHGNVIELKNAIVGFENACSGIDSVQATLMAALFLGEFFQLNFSRRVTLLLGGWVICLAANLGRIQTLIWIGHLHGQASIEHYHDTIGILASLIDFLLLLALVFALSRSVHRDATRADESASPKNPISNPALAEGPFIFLGVLAIPLGVWIFFTFLVAAPTAASPHTAYWSLRTDRLPRGWNTYSVAEPPNARAVLRFSQWNAADVIPSHGWTARVVHLYWKPGRGVPRIAFPHTTDICMPNAGWTQNGPAQQIVLTMDGARVPFAAYKFTQQGLQPVTVLQTLRQSGATSTHVSLAAEENSSAPSRFGRFSMLWHEPLRYVDEEIILYITNVPDGELTLASQSLLDTLFTARDPDRRQKE